MDDNRTVADLAKRGRLVPASDPTPLDVPDGDSDGSTDSAEVVRDLRADRL